VSRVQWPAVVSFVLNRTVTCAGTSCRHLVVQSIKQVLCALELTELYGLAGYPGTVQTTGVQHSSTSGPTKNKTPWL
jgi:hypothetical protein